MPSGITWIRIFHADPFIMRTFSCGSGSETLLMSEGQIYIGHQNMIKYRYTHLIKKMLIAI